jgi:hypothetical protein
MPRIIVLRLHPMEPIDGDDFTSYLDNLSITVSDLAMDTPTGVQVVPIGTADYLPLAGGSAPPADPPDYDPATTIAQHFETIPPVILGNPPTFQFVAVATAIIPIPGAPTEYLTSDLRIEVQRGAKTIVKRDLDFNVPQTDDIAAPGPGGFAGLSPVSLHIALPAPPKDADLNLATLELPADGTPPPFDDVYNAVRTVLVADPGVPNTDAGVQAKLETLTLPEARHIAYEIMYNAVVYPPPVPERELAELYTLDYPNRDDAAADQARDIFEAELIRHKALRSAQAERATGYVFALATAFQGQKLSQDATRVGFKFPVHPDAPAADSASKVKETEVILRN